MLFCSAGVFGYFVRNVHFNYLMLHRSWQNVTDGEGSFRH